MGGVPYLIDDQTDGILVSPQKPQLVANAIQNMIDEPAKAMSLARNARVKVEAFDWKKVKHSWITLLNH